MRGMDACLFSFSNRADDGAADGTADGTPDDGAADGAADGVQVNWMSKTDEEIIDATMGEIARLFPKEVAEDPKWGATVNMGLSGSAK
eukprot:1152371-Prorocentrum_minimum.AAC.2